MRLTNCAFQKKKRSTISFVASITERYASIQKLKFFLYRIKLMHKYNAAVSHRIWTILPLWAVEFCELVRRIWQNLHW